MDLSHPYLRRRLLRARVTLVAHPTEPLRRRKEEPPPPAHKAENPIRCLVRCQDRRHAGDNDTDKRA
jgi:hypothetical protein